ncbi:MAG TPA: PAS domain S-box protein, partial [Desulfosarcina sp.]|nr:PAS domain S-box protein [Desulfosarcina sp.]
MQVNTWGKRLTDQIKRVTEGRRTEGAPPARESLYRELVRNANSAIIRWRVDGTITFFNEYAEAFFGWSAAEVVGKHVSILVPEQESTGADLTDLVRDIVARPEKYVNNVNENVCRDGRRVWMTWTNKPIRDDQGSVTEILAIGSDVTALKQAETSLRASEQRLLLALEAAFLISFEWDIQRNQVRRFVSQEPALAATPQQKPGTFEDVLAVVHPNDRELFQANVDAALQSANGHYESQFRIVRPDGEIAWLHERGRVERDGQGRPWRLIGLSQEITDRKQAEAALRQSREDLERAQAVGKIGWWRLDIRRNVLTWSAENHRIFGVPEGTPMSYESFLAIVHPDDRRYVDTQWQASLR